MNQLKNSPKIGLVSGIGPLAGADVFARLIQYAAADYGAAEDHEYPDVLLINHGIKGVDNTASLSGQFRDEVAAMVHLLESEGSNVIGIACNTAHIYLDTIKTKPQTTLVNLIEEVSKAANPKKQYLLLTSSATRDQKLYYQYLRKQRITFDETNTKQQKIVDDIIKLVMSYHLAAAGVLMEKLALEAANSNYDGLIIGCTELPIALDHCQHLADLEIVNSNKVLAQSLLKNYYR